MTNGVLGSWALVGGAAQSVYCCDKTNGAVVTVNICNRGNVSVYARIAITATMNTVLNSEWIEYDVEIKPKCVLERTGVILNSLQYLTVQVSNDNANVVCWGVSVGDDVVVPTITQTIGAAPVWQTASTLSDVYAGEITSLQVTATDYNNITYAIASGTLPSGLSLNTSSGIISGTPAITGYVSGGVTSSFTVSATDAQSNVTPRSFSITRRWRDGTSATNAAISIAQLKTVTSVNGVYWLKNAVNGTPYQTYCLFDSTYDSGGWELAYNINANDATTMIGGLPHWDNTTFWTNANQWMWDTTTPWNTNVKTRAFDQRGITEVLILLHNLSGYNQANSRGWGVYSNVYQTGKDFLTLHTQGQDIILSSSGRKATANYAGNLTWNNRRTQYRGGDMFIDGTVNGYNNASDNLIINSVKFWGSDGPNSTRLGTTAGYNNSSYGHTLGGIGIRHANSGWGFYAAMTPIMSYCEPAQLYGNGTNGYNYANSPDSGNSLIPNCNNLGWANGNISCGYGVFVRQDFYMTNGVFGTYNLYSNVVQSLYVCDKSNGAVVTLNVCNRSNEPTFVRVAISVNTNSVLNNEWVEYDVEIKPKCVLERTGIMLTAGQYLNVLSSKDNVNAVCWGVSVGDDVVVPSIAINYGTSPVWSTAASLPNFYAGDPVSQQLVALSSSAVYYNVTSGSLPTGLVLNTKNGIISGTTAYTGYNVAGVSSTFTVTASDGAGNTTPRVFSIIKKWYDGTSATTPIRNSTDLSLFPTSGVYYIKTSSMSTAQQYYVDTATTGGPWIRLWLGTSDNYNQTAYEWDNTQTPWLLQDSQQFMYAFCNTANNSLTYPWSFRFNDALTLNASNDGNKYPFFYNPPMGHGIDGSPLITLVYTTRLADSSTYVGYLRTGRCSFGSYCDDGRSGTWGQICLKGNGMSGAGTGNGGYSDFPHYTTYAHGNTDNWARSDQVYTTNTVSSTYRFSIYSKLI